MPHTATSVHLDNIPWWKAEVPSRWHRCKVQTVAIIDNRLVERCACGGIREGFNGPWVDRNERWVRGKRRND